MFLIESYFALAVHIKSALIVLLPFFFGLNSFTLLLDTLMSKRITW